VSGVCSSWSLQNTFLINYTVVLLQIRNQSRCHVMLLLLSGIGVEVASVSLVLKESQSHAVELKPWMTIADLYCRLTVKFVHFQSMTNPSTPS